MHGLETIHKLNAIACGDERPLKPGTVINYQGILATVLQDAGGERVVVSCDGSRQEWLWELDGYTCTVIAKPL